jgi:hypothetical protein
MSPEASPGLTIRDLILEIRQDVRAMDTKLEDKADRDRVHDLANDVSAIKLDRAAERASQSSDLVFIRSRIEALPDHEVRLRTLERFRYAVPSAAVLGLGVAIATAAITFTH